MKASHQVGMPIRSEPLEVKYLRRDKGVEELFRSWRESQKELQIVLVIVDGKGENSRYGEYQSVCCCCCVCLFV